MILPRDVREGRLTRDVADRVDVRTRGLQIVVDHNVARRRTCDAGRVQLELPVGMTRVDGDDGQVTSAWVLGLDTPYYAITDDGGHFRIDELAGGSYDVTIWQAPLAAITDGKISYGAPVIVHRTIKVDPAKPAQLNVALGH